MNSKSLQQQYPHIYQEFFSKYDLVISCSILIENTGLIGRCTPSSMISHKLPLKNYIGINFHNKISDKIKYLSVVNIFNQFNDGTLDKLYLVDQNFFKKIGIDYEIGFLNEYNILDPYGILSLIFISLLIKQRNFNLNEFNYLNINHPNHKQTILKIINLLDNNIKYLNGFINKDRSHILYLGSSLLTSNSFIFGEFFNNEYVFRNIGDNNYSFFNLDLSLNIINPNIPIKSNYQSNIILETNKNLNNYMNSLGIKYNNYLLSGLNDLEKYLSLEIYKDILELYKGNNNNFFLNDERYINLLNLIYKGENNLPISKDKLKFTLLEILGISNINLSLSVGSNRVFIAGNKVLNINEQIIENLNEKLGTKFTLDYASNIDGFETEGLKLEQYRSQGIYSSLLSGYSLTSFMNGKIENKFADYKELIDNLQECVLLDKTTGKIKINNKILTSKELCSQTTTIEILEILIDKFGKEITNKDLPLSSYSKNKNEMLGKILLPFVKLVEEMTGKNIKISCKGGITDFIIKLESCEAKMYLIKKI